MHSTFVCWSFLEFYQLEEVIRYSLGLPCSFESSIHFIDYKNLTIMYECKISSSTGGTDLGPRRDQACEVWEVRETNEYNMILAISTFGQNIDGIVEEKRVFLVYGKVM